MDEAHGPIGPRTKVFLLSESHKSRKQPVEQSRMGFGFATSQYSGLLARACPGVPDVHRCGVESPAPEGFEYAPRQSEIYGDGVETPEDTCWQTDMAMDTDIHYSL